jgi:gluconokinase
MPQQDYILGADIGTSSSKALAFSVKGKILAQHQTPYSTAHPQPSFAEQDPDTIFQALISSIRTVVRERKGQPLCVSLSAAMHSLMAVNRKGEASSPLIIWSDGRSQAQADALLASKEAWDIYRHTGTPVHPMSPLCKLLWWNDHPKYTSSKVSRFLGIKDYILSRLFGEYLIDYSLASATGLFDHETLRWYEPALDRAGITPAHLPEPVSPLHVLTGLKKEHARQMGLSPDTPFVLGASDGCLANLGTGVTARGELAATIGTSGAVRLFNDRPINDRKQRLFNYLLLKKEFITGGAINNGGVLLDWFQSHFMDRAGTKKSYGDFLRLAMKAEPGSRGLLFLPYLHGERAPMWDARARGAFVGMHGEHKRMHFMRSVIEGICFSLYDIVHVMETPRTSVDRVYVSGGFTRSATWVQMLTDVFDKEVVVSGQGDASSVGAALLGMRALKMVDSWEETDRYVRVTRTFKPRKEYTSVYRRNYALFATLYESLRPAMHEIAGWQRPT